MTVHVVVNGQGRELSDDATVETLVSSLDTEPQGRGIAVAIEGEVVRRSDWPHTELTDGAHVEVVVAVQGG